LELVVGAGDNVDTNVDLFTASANAGPATPSFVPTPTASPVTVPFTWYVVDDDFGREPCEEDILAPKPYFQSEQNIIYYYFYRAYYYEPVVYYNAAIEIAPYLFGTLAAAILAVF